MCEFYTWNPPLYRRGDIVQFDHGKSVDLVGTICRVETFYKADGKAWHAYTIKRDGMKNFCHPPATDIRLIKRVEGSHG